MDKSESKNLSKGTLDFNPIGNAGTETVGK
jgi:hypothetical protein